MESRFKTRVLSALFCVSAFAARAVDADADAEKRSFFPLIPESTYTYNWDFKERKGSQTTIVTSARVGATDVFYFVSEKDVRNPEAIIGSNSIGLGIYLKAGDGIATLDCFWKNELSALKKANLDKAVTIIKESATDGTLIEARSDQSSSHTYRVDGHDDVTVPAGTFKGCLKLTIQEIWVEAPPKKNVVYTATAWLAKGVGLVKWIRTTGRVDELAAYKLAEVEKK